jgi:Ala-tRNA(Pro) deacylase
MDKILSLLKSLNIQFILHTHPPVFTCQDTKDYDSGMQSVRTKNLFLKTEKGDNFFLYILECEQRADLRSLSQSLSLPRLTFGKEPDLMRLLHLTPGSVSPFGLIHDTSHAITVLIDYRLKDQYLSFHPNTNTATVEISWPDFLRFLSHTSHPPKIVK